LPEKAVIKEILSSDKIKECLLFKRIVLRREDG